MGPLRPGDPGRERWIETKDQPWAAGLFSNLLVRGRPGRARMAPRREGCLARG